MQRLCLVAMITIAFSMLQSLALAKAMECSYNYTTWKTTFYLEEDSGPASSIEYSFRRTDSGYDDYKFNGSTELQDGVSPLVKMWDKMYYSSGESGRYIPALYFIDFERAKMHEFQAPSAYMEQLKNEPKFYTEQSASLRVPVQIWSCKRTD